MLKRVPFPFDAISKNIILLKYLFLGDKKKTKKKEREGKKKRKLENCFPSISQKVRFYIAVSHLSWAGLFVGTN